MIVTHLVPRSTSDIEQLISNERGLYAFVGYLKGRGVAWTEPNPPMDANELRDLVRVIYRDLLMRENQE